jgi:very-short-patch-repair endonuclease
VHSRATGVFLIDRVVTVGNHLSMRRPRNLTRIARNLRKHDTWAEKLLWKWVLRFWNRSMRQEKQLIRDTIWRTLQERAPKPNAV